MAILGEWRRGAAVTSMCAALVLAVGCGGEDETQPKFEMHSWVDLTPAQSAEGSKWMETLRPFAREAHVRIAGAGAEAPDLDECWAAWPAAEYTGPASLEGPVRSSWASVCQAPLEYTRG